MLPAHQRFRLHDRTGADVDLRLVVKHQLVRIDRMTQLAHEGKAPGAVLVQLGIVGHAPALLLLGDVHGHVGPLQKGVGIRSVIGENGNADARLNIQLEPFEPERRLQRLADLAAQIGGIIRRRDPVQKHRELVTAEPGHGVRLFHGALETKSDLLEQAIAVVVPERVVDFLEPVQVQNQDR